MNFRISTLFALIAASMIVTACQDDSGEAETDATEETTTGN
ncbi:hypothetical protein LX81_00966 [Palleronia aestuarii]|uniref:Uncharacterized protein n=1 Tax=Palleronia aestuarii TaxID=568105 RepID=A0A2W7NYG9_9RHOB|nr:hypothetical protein [Palleronia aestuarii]PZX18336.1 hypothetical protein LX81_00966 [Palleronia aestuarii]